VLPQVGDEIGGDGVHADDDEREGEGAVASLFDDPEEGRQEIEAEAAAEEGPGRGPDALDDGVDAEEMKDDCGGHERGTGEEEAADGKAGGGGEEPSTGDEAEDHGAEGGDEVEGEVSATVVEEGRGAGKEVEEPEVEGLAEVGVLVPVRCESVKEMAVPVEWDADRGVVEAGGRKGIERPCEPVADEDGGERSPLPAWSDAGEKEGEGVAEADLGEGVFQGDVDGGPVNAAKQDSEGDEDEAALDGVGEAAREGFALTLTATERIRESDSDEKGEGWLDEVVETEPGPFDVGLVEGEDAPKGAAGPGAGDMGEAKDLGHHEEHDETAVGVDRHVALGLEDRGRDRGLDRAPEIYVGKAIRCGKG